MQWSSEGLIIGVRRHGETSVIVEIMAAGRGRQLGLVRGGRSQKLAPMLQPGNSVIATWRARLEDHLGTFALEPLQSRAAALILDRRRLYLAQVLCEHLHLLPERDPHDRLLSMTLDLLDGDDGMEAMGRGLAEFELVLLDELGFGLDFSSCAATGVTEDLAFVSPRSGRAVSRAAAEPYIDRLLRLPPFLLDGTAQRVGDIGDALRLTGHFLDLHVWMARNIEPPAMREGLLRLLGT